MTKRGDEGEATDGDTAINWQVVENHSGCHRRELWESLSSGQNNKRNIFYKPETAQIKGI